MSDLISRQAAIDAIAEMGFQKTSTVKAILCRLETLPSAPDHHEHNLSEYAHDMGVSIEQAEKDLRVSAQPTYKNDSNALDALDY